MSAIDELLARNRAHALPVDASAEARPRKAVAVLTCMDARIDPAAALGLKPGEAHVLRNAGAAVTDDAIRSLALSQRLLGTEEVMLIKHTGCGMQSLDEARFRAELAAAAGAEPAWAIESFEDLDADVRDSLARLRECPFLSRRDRIRGFVYDVRTGHLREVSTG